MIKLGVLGHLFYLYIKQKDQGIPWSFLIVILTYSLYLSSLAIKSGNDFNVAISLHFFLTSTAGMPK